MSFFGGLFSLVASLLDLARAVVEAYGGGGRAGYEPKHLAPRRGGSAHKKSR